MEQAMVHHKGRVYKVVNKSGATEWLSVEQTSSLNGQPFGNSSFSDFEGGKFLDIPQADIDRALTRQAKLK
jgi:hypothetical protein